VRFTRTTGLQIADAAATVALIKQKYGDGLAAKMIRKVEEPAVEQLEPLKDEELQKIGVRRITTDSITVKAAKVEMGKGSKATKAGKKEAA
jgi:hypothetical protein